MSILRQIPGSTRPLLGKKGGLLKMNCANENENENLESIF